MKHQEREVQTVKSRQFILNLSDADVERLYRTAYSNGTTPAEVIEGFIMDLVGGTYTHGSDERELASRYFERCCYDLGMRHTFLSWALSVECVDDIKDIANLLETLQCATGELQYYAENPAEATPDIIQTWKEEQTDAKRDIDRIYADYTADMEKRGEPAQGMQDGIEAIKAYMRELRTMRDSEPDPVREEPEMETLGPLVIGYVPRI